MQFLNETDKRNWLVKIGTSRACQQAVNFPEVLVANKINKQNKEIIATTNTDSQKDITHESDHFQSIQENYTNHKELLINEIKIIQETLTNFTSSLEKSETACAELDKLELKNDENDEQNQTIQSDLFLTKYTNSKIIPFWKQMFMSQFMSLIENSTDSSKKIKGIEMIFIAETITNIKFEHIGIKNLMVMSGCFLDTIRQVLPEKEKGEESEKMKENVRFWGF